MAVLTTFDQLKEIAQRGQEIYDQYIRDSVEPQHNGQLLVIDVTTGNYEMAADGVTATDRALAKNPGALLYQVRVGHPTAYRIGRVPAVQRR